MLMQNDPFELLFRGFGPRGEAHNRVALDAYRRGTDVWVHIDLPGVAADAVDVSVERSVLTITAERSFPTEEADRHYISERPKGTFHRQVHLGESLDTDGIEADFADGVLTLRIPVSEKAKARKIEVGNRPVTIEAAATDQPVDAD